jgi:hypothetical protein
MFAVMVFFDLYDHVKAKAYKEGSVTALVEAQRHISAFWSNLAQSSGQTADR